VASLKNGGRLPMVLSMTCYSGAFDNPNSDTISERFLREPDKGAVAVFSASWRNAPSPNYSEALIDELMTPGQRIGDAIVKAKQKEKDRVLVETYNLFGDPAIVLNRPTESIRIARTAERWRDGVAVRLPEGDFGSAITVNWLNARGTALKSQTYATNERQFALDVPSKDVAAVNIYAEDAGGTRHAIGNFDFRPPPPPKPAKPAPKAVVAKAPVPVVPVAPRPDLPDSIASFGFDGTAKAKPNAKRAKDSAKVAEKTGDKPASKAGDKAASNAGAKTLGAAVAVQKGAGEGEP
jgi:peptidase C25-like protein